MDDDLKAIWQKCIDKLGFVPNVFSAYSLKPQRLRNFMPRLAGTGPPRTSKGGELFIACRRVEDGTRGASSMMAYINRILL